MGWFHQMRYEHMLLAKDGVGEFGFCYHKRRNLMRGVMFKPDLPGAVPHVIPGPVTLTLMLDADNAIQAMAILRAGEEADDAPRTSS